MSIKRKESAFLSDEYQVQFFGFSSKAFTDGIYNSVLTYLDCDLNVFKEFLIKNYSEEIPESKLVEGMDSILCLCVDKLVRSIDKFQVFVEGNILNIPDNILLPEDSVHSKFEHLSIVDKTSGVDSDIRAAILEIEGEKKKRELLSAQLELQDVTRRNLTSLIDSCRRARIALSSVDEQSDQSVLELMRSVNETSQQLNRIKINFTSAEQSGLT